MNQREIDLIEDPPLKNPYFTLPDVQFFVTPAELRVQQALGHTSASVIDLFGPFDKMTDDQQAKFILTLVQHSDFTPDYDAMAAALNLTSGNTVRRRFIAIAEQQGFNVEGDTIKAADPITPPSSKKKRRAPRVAPRRSKPKNKSNTAECQIPDEQSIVEASTESINSNVATTNETFADTGYGYLPAEAIMADIENSAINQSGDGV